MPKSTMILYHAGCTDGFGAAYAAWRALGDDAEYVPVRHGGFPPEIERGSEVYILDFCYPVETLREIGRAASHVTVIDHHITALRDLADDAERDRIYGAESVTLSTRIGDNIDVRFDTAHSGAVLAWQHFHAGRQVPLLLQYVQDRDLWRWELPDSREISAAIRAYPLEFKRWDRWAQRPGDVKALATEGAPILRHIDQQIEYACRRARWGRIGDKEAVIVNATAYASEVAERILAEVDVVPFVGVYSYDDAGRRVWSLRSRGDVDVGAIAAALGGGGHKSAAGFVEEAVWQEDTIKSIVSDLISVAEAYDPGRDPSLRTHPAINDKRQRQVQAIEQARQYFFGGLSYATRR